MSSRYQITGEINQGGVGVVLKAWDTKLSRHVAIKRFLSAEQRVALGTVDGDLLKEASTLSSMQHPNIVSIYDVNMEGAEGPEVIMEYLNGQDLEQAVAQAALTLEDFYQVAQQTLDALSNAHRMNLLHRDIKPSNIQVTWLANGKFVSKFVDFGLAKFFEKPSKQTVRHDGTVMGSIYYMAPEQFERQPLDHRSDLYSLGCVFYFALTMHRPFDGETVNDVIHAHLHSRPVRLRDFRPNVPRELEKWVEWLMSRLPDNRPEDAELALAALRQIVAGQVPDQVPGVLNQSQPVISAPMRTSDVKLPAADAFARGPEKAVASRGTASGSGKKKPRRSSRPLVIGSVAAAIAAGIYFAVAGGAKPTKPADTARAPSAADVLKAANRETELIRAKADLATVEAKLAMAQSSAATTALPSASPAVDLSRPPAGGLVLWFDAAKGTRADAAGAPSVVNGPAAQWMDNAAFGGTAIFQYTASSTKNKEENYPTLRSQPASAGLIAARPVISFDGTGDTLCVRDRDRTGDPLGDSLNGGNVSVFIVFRASGPDAPEGLLSARTDQKRTMWSLGVSGGGLVTTPGKGKTLKVAGTEREFRIGSLVIDVAGKSVRAGLIASDGRRESDERSDVRIDGAAKPEMIRMGTSDGSGSQQRSLFAGEVAEILIFNRALDRDARHHAEDYLRQKYFGPVNTAVTVNRK